MRIGGLKNRVQLHAPTPSQNGYGEKTSSYASSGTRWARIVTLSSKDEHDAGRDISEPVKEITVRYDSLTKTVNNQWRVVHGEVTYEIIASPENVGERNKQIKLVCKEIT